MLFSTLNALAARWRLSSSASSAKFAAMAMAGSSDIPAWCPTMAKEAVRNGAWNGDPNGIWGIRNQPCE